MYNILYMNVPQILHNILLQSLEHLKLELRKKLKLDIATLECLTIETQCLGAHFPYDQMSWIVWI